MKILSSLGYLTTLLRGSIREATLLAASAAILLFLTGFSFWLSQKALHDSEIADELSRFNAQLTEFVQMLRTVESSQRGFLLTGSEDLLGQFNEMSGELVPLAKGLQVAAPHNLLSSHKIAALLPDLAKKVELMNAAVAFEKNGQKDKALAIVTDGLDRTLTGRIEIGIRDIQTAGDQLVHQNEARTRYLDRLRVFTDAVGAMLILTFSSLSLFLLMKSNAGMRQAQQALSKTNAELEHIVDQRTLALRRANEEIQRFAYIVSHDLRSPLVNIMGFTSELETLRQELFGKLAEASALKDCDSLGKDFDEALAFIKSSIARMDRLINAILRISREGNRPLNPETVGMNGMVDTLLSGLAHQIRDKSAEIHVGPLPDIVTDRLAIEQIFANIIENAVKFLRPGRNGKIEIEGLRHGEEIVYSISDNGRGIDPKDHQRIFELFRRSGPQDIPGEGMGLAYVAALARRLGGAVDVQSSLDAGSTFRLTLPRKLIVQKGIAA